MKLTEIKIELENVKNLGLRFYFRPGWMLKNPKIQVENKNKIGEKIPRRTRELNRLWAHNEWLASADR